MKQKTFCCCSLSTATIFAAVICMLQCVYGLVWNAQLWLLMDGKTYTGLLRLFMKIDPLADYDAIHGLTVASTGLHAIWIFLTIMVFRANSILSRSLLVPWILFTHLQTLFDIGTTVYFTVKFLSLYHSVSDFWDEETGQPTTTLTYATLAILFSRGVLFWFVNTYLAHIVDNRGKEIDHNNAMLALYILSHLSPVPRQESSSQSFLKRAQSDPPPAYCSPSYVPKYAIGGCREDLESSWSLNVGESMQSLAFSNPIYPRLDQNSVSEVRHFRNAGIAPYGRIATIEQSFRHGSDSGVLPY